MKCQCGSNASKDVTSGNIVCTRCGIVFEEAELVSDLQYVNTIVQGNFISEGSSGMPFTRTKHGTPIIDSSQIRLSKAYKEIKTIASSLAISLHIVEAAKKYYNIATAKKFIQGRKTRNVVGVILYTVCRLQKTKHLLMDFSDVLQTNLYVLGAIYLKFIRLLQIRVPIIDPSLYLPRFCTKLEFAERNKEVTSTALRILQCMSRDWMTTGRRPSGLCGAAILIAARIHGFKRNVKQIVGVVHVCDETVRRRLEEFSHSPISNMTKEDFDALEIVDDGKGNDPPAFVRNRKKEKEAEKIEKDKKKFEEKAAEIEKAFAEEETKITSEAVETTINQNDILSINNQINSFSHKIEDECLSDLENKEESFYIVSAESEEYKLKKILWEVLFKDWIEEQNEKKDREKKITNKKRPRNNFTRLESSASKTPAEAIIKSNRFSKKINVNVLNKLFAKDK